MISLLFSMLVGAFLYAQNTCPDPMDMTRIMIEKRNLKNVSTSTIDQLMTVYTGMCMDINALNPKTPEAIAKVVQNSVIKASDILDRTQSYGAGVVAQNVSGPPKETNQTADKAVQNYAAYMAGGMNQQQSSEYLQTAQSIIRQIEHDESWEEYKKSDSYKFWQEEMDKINELVKVDRNAWDEKQRLLRDPNARRALEQQKLEVAKSGTPSVQPKKMFEVVPPHSDVPSKKSEISLLPALGTDDSKIEEDNLEEGDLPVSEDTGNYTKDADIEKQGKDLLAAANNANKYLRQKLSECRDDLLCYKRKAAEIHNTVSSFRSKWSDFVKLKPSPESHIIKRGMPIRDLIYSIERLINFRIEKASEPPSLPVAGWYWCVQGKEAAEHDSLIGSVCYRYADQQTKRAKGFISRVNELDGFYHSGVSACNKEGGNYSEEYAGDRFTWTKKACKTLCGFSEEDIKNVNVGCSLNKVVY